MTGSYPPEDHPSSAQTCPSSTHPESANSSPLSPSPGSSTATTKESNPQPDPPPPILSQPKPGPPEQGDRGSGPTQANQLSCGAEEKYCGICRHLVLALVLVVLSPVIAVGVCVADIVTGECFKTYDDESEEDWEKQ